MFEVKPLPYTYAALQPALSEQTLLLHHDKHYATYVANLNRLTEESPYATMPLSQVVCEVQPGAIFNNAAQAWNHEFYFAQFSATPKREPEGDLLDAIEAMFGTVEELKKSLHTAAMSLFGSGWVWLTSNEDNTLSITQLPNADNPLRHGEHPLLTIDVWEHAYYVDYQNRRADAVEALWSIIDWSVVEERYYQPR